MSKKAEKKSKVIVLVQKDADFMVSSLFSAFTRPVLLLPVTISYGISPLETQSN